MNKMAKISLDEYKKAYREMIKEEEKKTIHNSFFIRFFYPILIREMGD
jgi:hypothetical protein